MAFKGVKMKINKYLKELGLEKWDMPGYYDKKIKEDVAGADIRNKEDEEGFCEREFFNLDYTLALYIYPRLCYYRDNISDLIVPGVLCGVEYSDIREEEKEKMKKEKEEKWHEILDKMIEGFRIKIVGYREGYEGVDAAKVREGMQAFVDYYDCLWY